MCDWIENTTVAAHLQLSQFLVVSGELLLYIVLLFPSCQLLLWLSFTKSVRYFLGWTLSSSCTLNITHLFVSVVGNCSKSKPCQPPSLHLLLGLGRGWLVYAWGCLLSVTGPSAATGCQRPAEADTRLIQRWRWSQRARCLMEQCLPVIDVPVFVLFRALSCQLLCSLSHQPPSGHVLYS